MIFKPSKQLVLIATLGALLLTISILIYNQSTLEKEITLANRLIETTITAKTIDDQVAAVEAIITYIEQGGRLLSLATCTESGTRTSLLPGKKWGDLPAYGCITPAQKLKREVVVFRLLSPGIWNNIRHHLVK